MSFHVFFLQVKLISIPFLFLVYTTSTTTTAPSFKDAFDEAECSVLNTLNGFVFVLSKDGDLVYLSDNVERHLGLNHIDLLGQSIYDFSHPCDHDDIKLFLEPLTSAYNAAKLVPNVEDRSVVPSTAVMSQSTGPFFIRMKCTLTNKGRNCNLKSAYFKVSVVCVVCLSWTLTSTALTH